MSGCNRDTQLNHIQQIMTCGILIEINISSDWCSNSNHWFALHSVVIVRNEVHLYSSTALKYNFEVALLKMSSALVTVRIKIWHVFVFNKTYNDFRFWIQQIVNDQTSVFQPLWLVTHL